MYRTDCDTAHPVLLNRLSKVNPSFIYKWGAEGRGEGGYHMLMSDWRAIMTPRRPPWTACVHFPNSYPTDVSHLSFNFLSVCCYSMVSISMSLTDTANLSTCIQTVGNKTGLHLGPNHVEYS
jgi:hypothetical protein